MSFDYKIKKYFLNTKVILFLSAFIFRLFFLLIMLMKSGHTFSKLVLTGDALDYYHLAFNLKYLFSLSVPAVVDLPGVFLRTPGYPLFLAAIFLLFKKSIVAVMLIQALLSGISAVLIYRISNLVNFHKLVGLSSAILFSVEPMSAITSNSILAEPLFLFLFLLFFYLLTSAFIQESFSKKRFFLLGIIFGAGVLVRPVLYPYIILVIIFAVLYLLKKLNFRNLIVTILIFTAGVYLLVFPWILRNKIVFDSWSVSSIEGVHLFYSYAVPFFAYENHLANKDIALEQLSPKLNIVGDRYDLRNNQTYNKLAKEIIKQNPLGYVFFHLSNTISFFMSNGYRNIGRELGFDYSAPSMNFSFMRLLLTGNIKSLFVFLKQNLSYLAVFIAGAFMWLLINIFMILGIVRGLFWKKMGTKKFFILFFAATVAYFALTAGPEAYYKMRFPVNPFIFMLAFYGFYNFLFKFKKANYGLK